jgi:hypothetical protein
MAHIEDRWHKIVVGADGKPQKECTSRYGNGLRWRARHLDPDGYERNRSFSRRLDAERFLYQLLETWCCLMPECRHGATTDAPVLLCRDHLDLLLWQLGRKRSGVHSPVVYFIRNGSWVQIGWTTNLKACSGPSRCPCRWVMLTLPGGPAEETQLHHRLRAARDGKTEWFEVTPEIERFIIQRLAGEGADAVSPGAETASRDGRRRYDETKSA